MRNNKQFRWLGFISLILAGTLAAELRPGQKFYYATEIDGIVCGYAEINLAEIEEDEMTLILLKHDLFLMLKALGSTFNSTLQLTYRIDPVTGQFTYHDSYIHQGDTELSMAVHITDNKAIMTSPDGDDETVTSLTSDVILPNTLYHPFLVRDFSGADLQEKTYRIYQVRDSEIQESTFKKQDLDRLKLAGDTYEAIIFEEMNRQTGVKTKLWIDTETGQILKTQYPNHRLTYLTDPSVVKRIRVADMNPSILTKTNVAIGDAQAIAYLKVRAVLEPTGLWVTEEGLNVPGQRFTGTVKENRIEGVFEVEHPKYDGAHAPAFPTDDMKQESLQEFLKPDDWIESDDPVLIEKARNLTKGSQDAWEAACRLSRWVSENIEYAIPGGVTARKTYDVRRGECGAHSLLLAALCRCVGIPARVVWGCMYLPTNRGVFGQHAWNEIYMGSAGWVPVDATAFEIDYVDSGHIRVGLYQSAVTALNAQSMEILDHRVGFSDITEDVQDNYKPFVGRYNNPMTGRICRVSVENTGVVVDITGVAKLAFHDPDDRGFWICKMAPHVSIRFDVESGIAQKMQIHETRTLPKKAGESINDDVPEQVRHIIGKYLFQALNAEFEILYRDGKLMLKEPGGPGIVLECEDDGTTWEASDGTRAITFVREDDGKVNGMAVTHITNFFRDGSGS